MNKGQERREAALWRLERDLRNLRVKTRGIVPTFYQTWDMERMGDEIKSLKKKLGKA
jgi:hypothetical protein